MEQLFGENICLKFPLLSSFVAINLKKPQSRTWSTCQSFKKFTLNLVLLNLPLFCTGVISNKYDANIIENRACNISLPKIKFRLFMTTLVMILTWAIFFGILLTVVNGRLFNPSKYIYLMPNNGATNWQTTVLCIWKPHN